MRLARSGSSDRDDVEPLDDEAAAGEVAHKGFIDRSVLEGEVDVVGQRQHHDGELVLDRARLFLRDLGLQEIADEALRLVLALNGCGQRLVVYQGAGLNPRDPQRPATYGQNRHSLPWRAGGLLGLRRPPYVERGARRHLRS
jgi:hypothetical protein